MLSLRPPLQNSTAPTQNRYEYDIVVTVRK
jgi:hypothetical protein